MIDYFAVFVNTNGIPFPGTLTINATGAGTGDGTEMVKLFGDDLWGARQALIDAAGLTPDSVTEAPGTSQLLDAIRKICGSPGEGVIWFKNSDPAVTGDRVLLLNGQGILRANYPELDAAVYVGDPDNPTASAFYHADDAAGTIRNTTGIYLILPETRGYVLRGLDTAASVDPDGASRDLGSIQDFALQGHAHRVSSNDFTNVQHGTPDAASTFFLESGLNDVFDADQLLYARDVLDLAGYGTVKIDIESRMVNVATKFGIRY